MVLAYTSNFHRCFIIFRNYPLKVDAVNYL